MGVAHLSINPYLHFAYFYTVKLSKNIYNIIIMLLTFKRLYQQ